MTLLLGTKEQDALKAAMARARERPVTLEQTMRHAQSIDQMTNVVTLEERAGAAPERYVQMVELPIGYRVNISYEQQPAGLCLHISMSTSRKGMLPHPEAVNLVLETMTGCKVAELDALRAWIEEYEIDGKPGGMAVNVVILEVTKH